MIQTNADLYRSWDELQIFGIPGYDSERFAEQHGIRLLSDYTLGELCLVHTPRLNPASLDYLRLHYRIARAVVG